MTVLIIDDDRSSHLLLERLLSKKLRCDNILHAYNGLEGLDVIQKEHPDFVLCDIRMPIMDGKEVVDIIRSTPSLSSLPIVIMSAINDRTTVLELLSMGVADYLLKPLQLANAQERLTKVLADIKQKSQQTKIVTDIVNSGDRPPLLLVDEDYNFRQFVASALSDRFMVVEAENGVDGLQLYLQHLPHFVLVQENLSLMNERLFATKIRTLNPEHQPFCFLCSETLASNLSDVGVFSGIIKKSFVESTFLTEFGRVVLGERNVLGMIVSIIQKQLSNDITMAIEQAFGLMTMQGVKFYRPTSVADIGDEVRVTVNLVEIEQHITIELTLGGLEEHISSTAQRILGSSTITNQDSYLAFSEILNAVAGRLRTAFDKHKFSTELSQPIITHSTEHKPKDWKYLQCFRTDSSENFFFGIAIATASNTPS